MPQLYAGSSGSVASAGRRSATAIGPGRYHHRVTRRIFARLCLSAGKNVLRTPKRTWPSSKRPILRVREWDDALPWPTRLAATNEAAMTAATPPIHRERFRPVLIERGSSGGDGLSPERGDRSPEPVLERDLGL